MVSKKLMKKQETVYPVYECADTLIGADHSVDADSKFGSMHSYCDPKTSFNNPFYQGKRRGNPSVRSVPGSVRRFPPTPFTRAVTIHSTKNKMKSLLSGKVYEVPQCEMELTPTSTTREESLRQSLRAPPVVKPSNNGYLGLSGDFRDPASVYVGLLK